MAGMSAARSNGARLNLRISRMIARTSRMARAPCDFRVRSRLVVNWSGLRRIAPERYLDRHRQTNRHEARERIGADA
jgi:hypothetical protein